MALAKTRMGSTLPMCKSMLPELSPATACCTMAGSVLTGKMRRRTLSVSVCSCTLLRPQVLPAKNNK